LAEVDDDDDEVVAAAAAVGAEAARVY